MTHHQLYHANTITHHQILSTKKKNNLQMNVNQRQREIQIMYLCQLRPGAAELRSYLAGTENEFLYETFWSYSSP